jgi:hypothetical protein
MRKINNTWLAIALVAAFTLGLSSMANAGAFGSPDPVPGAMVMGWFDIGADADNSNDNVLPVILNMSSADIGSAAGERATFRVHLIIWDVRSAHAWDKNLILSPWDVWNESSIRDLINEMSDTAETQLTETVVVDGVETHRYRGYWTATVVTQAGAEGEPDQLSYPHAYDNILGGWVYVVDIPGGRTDGYAMVAVEAAQLWAETVETTFMLSFSADFWNRPWWWLDLTYVPGQGIPAGPTDGPYYSALWNCTLDQAYEPYGMVYERFDATACLNASLLSTGKAVTSDDTWLARIDSCYELPYDGGTLTGEENAGGMFLFGRYYRNPAGGTISNFYNRLVLWFDTNSSSRSVNIIVYNEEEDYYSVPMPIPDELNIIRLDTIVPDNFEAGFVRLHTRFISSPGAEQRMLTYWRSVIDNPATSGATDDYYNCVANTLNLSADEFLPRRVNCALVGAEADIPFGNALQVLGWTTNEGMGTAQESWGAIFPLIRRCILGNPTSVFAISSATEVIAP